MSDDERRKGIASFFEVESGVAVNPAPQRDVLEFYRERAVDAAAVGGYVRVDSRTGKDIACFGPNAYIGSHGWQVVEINWDNRSFLLAPISNWEAGYE